MLKLLRLGKAEKPKKAESNPLAVRFSIGAKLVTIITVFVLISLGTITALVTVMVSEDLRITAEVNNFEVNQSLATELEYILSNLNSNSLVLMQIIMAAGAESSLANQSAYFFFEQNPHIAALVFSVPGRLDQFLINEPFFRAQETDVSIAELYIEKHERTLQYAIAQQETLFLNAAPDFGLSLLTLFFPWQNGGGGAILFSSDILSGIFSSETNQSYLINNDGDILFHSDFELMRIGANLANRDFIRLIRESPQSDMQRQYTDEGIVYFGAFTKLKPNIGAPIIITSIEYDKVFEELAATTRRNIYLTAAVLSISILLIWFFSKSISNPLKVLAAAAKKIEEGTFELKLQAKTHDEIGLLTKSFQRMSVALGIFGRFTNREIAVRAMQGEIKPGGLPKHATIFFSDIRDFTAKSENFTKEFGSMASDKIVHWLNEYFTKMVECVEKTGGVVDKFIGDAVMAHWGTAYTSGSPVNDAFNCVKAALMMRAVLYEMNKKRDPNSKENPPIHIGCGINTGIVTAGQIGSDLRMEYTVIGDPVNLASRTEAMNKPFGTDILITEATWNLVKSRVITEEMPSVTVKGKEKPVRLFAVVNMVNNPRGPRTLADVRRILGTTAPDLSKVDVNAEEKKYKIGGTN